MHDPFFFGLSTVFIFRKKGIEQKKKRRWTTYEKRPNHAYYFLYRQ
ncbi:hypothetical protein CHCC20495_2686 [Bacillus licheniformis]|nr:hypothetical protein CHCC20495_2686 [Bacillus licheniformis]